MMSKHFAIVGSLLRPADLLAIKDELQGRTDITYPFYDAISNYAEVEEKATKVIVEEQKVHGLSVISDGEFSKSLWHTDFVWGLGGVERYVAEHGYYFRDFDGESRYETRKDIGVRIVGKLSGKNHHFISIFKRLKTLAGENQTVKLCVPSPSHIFGELSWSDNVGIGAVYENTDDLRKDLVQAYKDFVSEYADNGGEILQFDDCLWEIFAEDNPNSPFTGQAIDQNTAALELAQIFIEINNEVIDYAHDLGLTVWTHNCRGNYASRNMGAGSYDKIADLFLKNFKYDRFFLEWDDERAGSLKALEVFKNRDTEVVLGLLSSKTPKLDDELRVKKLLEEAAQILPKERLYLSHQCGFASCDNGNELTQKEQWAKIEQGQHLAEEFWNE
ncbi:5-methyltetrahydropteroyltriglutamate--homocysteine methyltransferase [Lactococcus allomyrinae]